MSDVSNAPAPAAAPAPAPSEVAITPSAPQAPTPLGPQTPSKPVDAPKPENRRETIAKAFERARDPDRAKPEAAKPKMGHNQPPEPMEREKPKRDPGPPIDLKKRPADQEQREPQPREQGRFAPREPDAQKSAQNSATPAQQGAQPAQRRANPLPENAPYRDPPQRMADHAKAEWHAAPESVRGEVHRMHHEFGKAFQAYRADHEAMNSIRPFHQMAAEHGTTLERALSNYTQMEHKLRSDVVGGLDLIINNLNLQTPDGQRLGLHDVAWHIVNQTPEQRQLLQSQNKMMAQTHQLQAAQQRIAALEQHAKQVQYREVFHHTRSGVDQYAAQHPRLDELADLITAEIKLGFDLDTAYRRAELLRPANPAAQTRNGTQAAQTRAPTAQTRNSDRSISGAPDGGPAKGSSRRADGKAVGRREAIANALKRVNGAL